MLVWESYIQFLYSLKSALQYCTGGSSRSIKQSKFPHKFPYIHLNSYPYKNIYFDNDRAGDFEGENTNITTKEQPGALKLPHTQGPGKGPTIWCIVRSLTLFFYTRGCFQDLNP